MPLEISDTRPDELESVLSFCGLSTQGEAPPARPFLSLTAQADGHMVGALVCDARGQNSRVARLVVRGTNADHEITRQLIGKATRRLHAQGIHRCRITTAPASTADTPADSDAAAFWALVAWSDRPDLNGAEQVIRVKGRR